MTHISEALPESVAVVMTLVSLAAIVLLIRTRRSLAAQRTARETALSERDRALAEQDRTRVERDKALTDQEAAHQETARINSGRTALLEETQHLVSKRMPALITHLSHQHVPVPGLKHPAFGGTEVEQLHRSALEQLSKSVAEERERVDESAQAVMRGATTVIQAQSYQLQSKVEAMQHRYDGPDLAGDLLELDLLNEQNLRRIQATGVLCGATPGLTRVDSHLGDVVVGAQSRVRGYHRIHVTSQLADPVAVVARAVEPIAITVSELLANAVHHSHGTLAVDVSIHQVESGACVIIDDAGVGMHADEIEFAQRMLSGLDSLRLSELGDPPRSGFATIGRLVRQHGFSVSVDKPAAYGGVRAVVLIPGHLLSLLDQEERPMSAMTPQSQATGRVLTQPYAVSDFQTPQLGPPPSQAAVEETPPAPAERFHQPAEPSWMDESPQAVEESDTSTPAPDPYTPDPYTPDPGTPDPYPADSYTPDPYPADPYALDPYAADSYTPDSHTTDAPKPDGIEGLPRRRRRRPQPDEEHTPAPGTNSDTTELSSHRDGLPQDARPEPARAWRDAAAPQEASPHPVTEQHNTPEETGAAWSAFQAGTESGRAAAHGDRTTQAHTDAPEGSN